jgi:predicted RecB family nuclease
VLDDLVARATDKGFQIVDLRKLNFSERLTATIAAVNADTDIIIAPELPPDWEGHREGSPDILSRHDATSGGTAGYLPVQIKQHPVLTQRRILQPIQRVSYLCSPVYGKSVPLGRTHQAEQIAADLIQLAHYHQQLKAIGWATSRLSIGGLIGNDPVPANSNSACALRHIAWIDLAARAIPTPSKTHPGKNLLRSPLTRYDHEFAFRVKVAQAAARRTDSDMPPTVRPIHTAECSHCPWWHVCSLQLDPSDLSLAIDKSPLDIKEIRALRSLNVLSVTDLATSDMNTLLSDYLPQVSHRHDANQRLLLARHRAEMLTSGVVLLRTTTDPLSLPRAALEIDFDIETNRRDQVYLWGFLLSTPGSDKPSEYHSFARFTPMNATMENDLATEALEWLLQLLQAHPEAVVYHYGDYELRQISHFDYLVAAKQLISMRNQFYDLFHLVRQHYFGVHGIGLKQVARHGAGFQWRDDSPSGLASQAWFEDAVGSADAQVRAAMRRRLLAYNEDDTQATKALREWLSAGGVVPARLADTVSGGRTCEAASTTIAKNTRKQLFMK